MTRFLEMAEKSMLGLADQEKAITDKPDLVVDQREIWSCKEAVTRYCPQETHGAYARLEKKKLRLLSEDVFDLIK